jgi:aspartate/methionine/tyrosine aminotransferase
MGDFLELMTDEERNRFHRGAVTYTPSRGNVALREEIAQWHGVSADEVQIVTGASEGLLCLFFLAAAPECNVIVPQPGFPTFSALPESLGLEVRSYVLRPEKRFEIDVDEIRDLTDEGTKLILINRPHNPTGASLSADSLREIHDFAAERNIQLVVDEVYHPIYYGEISASAAALPHATLLGDCSKSLSLSGLRVGWIIERDEQRLEQYWNARSYFTISNSFMGEALAEAAVRHRDRIFSKARAVSTANLELLDTFFAEQEETLGWVRPKGGFTSFPWLRQGIDSRELCRQAGERGVSLAPGFCFDASAHFRLGFGACENGFSEALEILADVLSQQ